ncbi:TonB-dependent receptor plug domain-containing protein [Pedobacter flavus]|uniref:TonB-dependent receptor n=1 Tax=Pedobacter flavus TaxID=3113906 RepID=A0ABU7GXN2_9SPHI|nr:TonB-dependent receptor [Pedobacter sp. VNH31]MEE1883794.1 TonB-dependent receptor [Pedobacter sp. VNH31]
MLNAQTDTIKTQHITEVKITALDLSPYLNSATPVQLLNSKDIQRLKGVSIADALRFFSGVQLKDYGGVGGLKTINVRSMGSNHTSVFYNGSQLSNAQNGQVDLSKYSLENLKEISLYSGQNPELLQSARAFASSSALFLKSQSPVFFPNKNQHFKLNLKTGSFNLLNPQVLFARKLSDKISWVVNSELLNSDGKYKYRYTNGVYDTTMVRQNGDILSKRIESELFVKFADSSQINNQVYYYNSERGLPGAIVSNKFNFSQRQWDRNFFYQSSYTSDGSKKFKWLAQLKYSNDFLRYVDPDYKTLFGILDNRYYQHEVYVSLSNSFALNKHWNFSFSNDLSKQDLNANLYNFAYPTRYSWLSAVNTKFEKDALSLQATLLRTSVKDAVMLGKSGGDKENFSPTLLASWQPFQFKNLKIRGFYKSIFRLPTFNDLYYTSVGNTSLDPEIGKQIDLGFTYSLFSNNTSLKTLIVRGDVYDNQIKDKIVAIPTLNLFRWTMVNLDRVQISGAEIQFQTHWQFNKLNALIKGNYTYEKAVEKTESAYSYGHQIPYIPVHSGSLTAALDFKTVSLNYSFIYTGERYSQKANIPVNYIPAWYTHDLAIHKALNILPTPLRISAEINNLLNQYYDIVLNYPMPGRNYRFTLYTNF